MTPSTKALLEYLRDDDRLEEPEGGFEQDDVETPEDRQVYQLKLKKKRNQMMLKKMLEEQGYSDLAKMVNISKTNVDYDNEEY